jgi:hypothetical protein
MALLVCSLVVLLLAALPVAMFLANLPCFRSATREQVWLERAAAEDVAVLIPARNEAAGIGLALDHLLAGSLASVEIYVLDDQSEDDTAAVVRQRMVGTSRLRLVDGVEMPAGWNGKQHACWQLANAARAHAWLLFLDADVRVTPDAVQRMVAEALRTRSRLISGFPYQETGSFAEKLLIPLMHFLLLGYLPIRRMRGSTDPSLAAGCGQMMLAHRETYFNVGGHRAIQASRHDGLLLPRVFRRAGQPTDIFDATDIAACRMYRDRRQVVQGLLKNATEGIAQPPLIWIFTVLLLGAAVLPSLLWLVAWQTGQPWSTRAVLTLAACFSFLPRLLAAIRFRQSWLGVVFHPWGVLWFLGLQWRARWQKARGYVIPWRGRN